MIWASAIYKFLSFKHNYILDMMRNGFINFQHRQVTGNIVKSPLVGTFYAAPSEEAEAFVQVGDKVKKGQTLAIVEAMKLMNDIESEYDGVVSEVFVQNGCMVEYGQPLFAIG